MLKDEVLNDDGTVCDKFFIGNIIYRMNLRGVAPTQMEVREMCSNYREIDHLMFDKILGTLIDEYYVMKDIQWDSDDNKWDVRFRTYKSVTPLYDKLLEVCKDDNFVEVCNGRE